MYKGGKKGGYKNTEKNDNNESKNRELLDKLLPLVSGKIDEHGGVLQIHKIANAPEVKELLEQIPAGYPKNLNKILQSWTDFFVNMPNGLIGTAMGYDTGMIRPDGTLDPAFSSSFKDGGSGGKGNVAPKKAPVQNPGRQRPNDTNLQSAADNLWRACLDLDDESGFYSAFSQANICRMNLKGSHFPYSTAPMNQQIQQGKKTKEPINFTVEEREQRRQEILETVIDRLSNAENNTMALNKLAQDPKIAPMKKGAISKFMAWIQEFPHLFTTAPIPDSPQFSITLIGTDTNQPPAKRARHA